MTHRHRARFQNLQRIAWLIPIFAVLSPLAQAQTAGAASDSPIEVVGEVRPLDLQVSNGYKAGPGLFLKVHNVSGRPILGFAFETIFTDPDTGKLLDVHEHSAFHPASRGINLPPDGTKPNPRPYQMPTTALGKPAHYSFKVDLVIFGDGSKWGPAKLDVSQAILVRYKAEK